MIKFSDASNKFATHDAAGTTAVSLIEAELLEAIMSIKDSVLLIILVGV